MTPPESTRRWLDPALEALGWLVYGKSGQDAYIVNRAGPFWSCVYCRSVEHDPACQMLVAQQLLESENWVWFGELVRLK